VHTIGEWAGRPFVLAPWEREFVYHLFSTVDAEGYRTIRTALLFIARKNGKSQLAAPLALFLLLADQENSPQVYGAASDRDQASLVFNVAASIVRANEFLSSRLVIRESTRRIWCPSNNGFYRAIPADEAGAHGFSASGIIFDELHTQRTRRLWDVLRTSTIARRQPLTLAITTAGYDKQTICHEVYQHAKRVEAGLITDRAFHSKIFEVPEGTSFDDVAAVDEEGNFTAEETLWPLANPSLASQPGGFLKPDGIRIALNEARHNPSMQNAVMRLHFNVWTAAESRWFGTAAWDACCRRDEYGQAIPLDEEQLAGRECYGGLDLASTSDFTAWILVFPWEREGDEDDPLRGFDVLARFWLPLAAVERRADMRDTLEAWERACYLTVTQGDVFDDHYVRRAIIEDARRFQVREIGIDYFRAAQAAVDLSGEGLKVVDVIQGFKTLTPPSKLLEKLVGRAAIDHGGNPILRWMADNVVAERDANDGVKPSKKHSTEKIDGIAALVNALERAMHPAPEVAVGYVPSA
jgi:phage terminase large subunit-like protein